MAVTVTNSSKLRPAFSIGPLNVQIVEISAASGATSGTVTADSLKRIDHILLPNSFVHTAAPTFSGNVATLTFTVPAATAATLTKGGVTYEAVATDATGNLISVTYTDGATAGAEVVTVTGNAISVQIESGVSTITEVRTAVNLEAAAAALVTATGTSGTAVAAAAASFLTGGISGAVGSALCFGV